MKKSTTVYRSACLILSTVFAALCLFPLATLAFQPLMPDAKTEILDESPQSKIFTIGPENTVPQTDLPVYDSITYDERQSSGLSTESPQIPYYYGDKVVYLTFDDGPDPENTPVILKTLSDQGVKATFFIVGAEAEKYPELVQQIFQAGHAIGNHTYSHVYRDVYQSPAAYTAQLNHADKIIKQIIGVRPRITRAPGGTAGNFTKSYRDALKKQGYTTVDWNISSGDASKGKAADLTANILRQINANKYLWSPCHRINARRSRPCRNS